MSQLTIDFVHVRENNFQSDSLLGQHRLHFNTQCQKVYDLLKEGKRLTVMSAMNDYQIMSLPRRILDIEQKLKIKINREITGRIVTYYL